jgi:hypothetical protein
MSLDFDITGKQSPWVRSGLKNFGATVLGLRARVNDNLIIIRSSSGSKKSISDLQNDYRNRIRNVRFGSGELYSKEQSEMRN